MKIVYNNIIPFKGFIAINLFEILFVRKEYKHLVTREVINHEKIHSAQMRELLYIPFYLIYIIEWLFKGYRNISFEKEAFENDQNLDYLKQRKHYAQWKKAYPRN